MDYKLFASTFVLIFLAELGDKTQLAAMARTAGAEGSKWVVFAAASLALVFSTLIAVVFGSTLTRLVPVHYIKAAAGTLFIVFGVLILHGVFAARGVAATAAPGGVLARVVLRVAAQFEEAAARDYAALAAAATDPRVRALFEALAQEERQHLAHITQSVEQRAEVELPQAARTAVEAHPHLDHDVAGSSEPAVEHAAQHEEATAGFYRELAALTPLPALRTTFSLLAAQEEDHARRLRAL